LGCTSRSIVVVRGSSALIRGSSSVLSSSTAQACIMRIREQGYPVQLRPVFLPPIERARENQLPAPPPPAPRLGSSGPIWDNANTARPTMGSQYFCKNDFSTGGGAGRPVDASTVGGGARAGLQRVQFQPQPELLVLPVPVR
jgi:hypothetical protein